MFTELDRRQMASNGITEEQVNQQLKQFENGFPFLKLKSAASVGNGIIKLDDKSIKHYIGVWNSYLKKGNDIVKFVPASGAASRMFKDLFAFYDANYDIPQTGFEKRFFDSIKSFAFYKELNDKCIEKNGISVEELIHAGKYKQVVDYLLNEKGLNYGQLPKGLLSFHKQNDEVRTPMEEHLVEGAAYAASAGIAKVHFTVSKEHRELFKELARHKSAIIEKKFGLKMDISFSEQKTSTDTIAVDMNNKPFRNYDGSLLFRPGGHGALIENLNDINADIVFIKNIDNVVPDRLKKETITYKKVIAGLLVSVQEKIFEYLRLLNESQLDRAHLLEIADFMEKQLSFGLPDVENFTEEQLCKYLKQKLDRPIRICGVVKNVGEPGGGPFLIIEDDGSVSLQILESSQIDKSNPEYVRMFAEGTHFNPVDLVCAIKDIHGKPFDLLKFVDGSTGFISYKSKDGRELKALELPGLWNGAMSNWNTLFVEVPLVTFNPVKTVNDLLRDEHQG